MVTIGTGSTESRKVTISTSGFVVAAIWQFARFEQYGGSYIVEWNVQMAGSILAALPTLVVFIFLGRYFMRGLLAGSLKG
jgi:glucose/mannose transport system permease protein